MRFISHLDLVRLFQRASRRASLPIVISKGFSPRLKISITRAIKLGLESPDEEAVLYLEDKLESPDLIRRLNENLPPGVSVTSAEEIL
jgi:radical SAM-linked protein